MARMMHSGWRALLRRHPGTILYHIGLLIFVVFVVVRLTGVSHTDKDYEKRAVVDTSALAKLQNDDVFVVNPSLPLDRVADEALAEWISLLMKERTPGQATLVESDKAAGPDVAAPDFGAAIVRDEDPAGAYRPAAPKDGPVGPDSVEVLGEGGSPRNASLNKVARMEGGTEHLPVPKILRKQVRDRLGINNYLEQYKDKLAAENARHSAQTARDGASAILNDKQGNVQDREHGAPYEPSSQKVTSRANVLIVAAMRTGSSFLGELFQQRNDFFYMFEPGIPIMHSLDSLNLTRRVMYTKLVDMLDRFYRCNFNGVSFFIDELNAKTLHARRIAVPALVTTQFCRRERRPHVRPKDACDPVSPQALATACTTRANTAIKSIRVLDINLMISAIKDPSVNLKLIHLVRDPRSMIVSRLRLLMPSVDVFNVTDLSDTHRNILLKYCSNWLQNFEIGHYVPLMRKNYLMVRYEDLALDPYGFARKVYEFVGVGAEIPPAVQVWLDQNTNVNDPSQKRAAAFSTKRDSKAVLVSWKRRVTLEMARAIEEVGDCTRLMQATGYKPIGYDNDALTNSDHLVGPLPSLYFNVHAFDFL